MTVAPGITPPIQCCGIGTVTDSLSAIKKHIYEDRALSMEDLLKALGDDFKGAEALRLRLWNKTPFYGNDDDYADDIMKTVYNALFNAIDGRPNTKGDVYHMNMLSTTCHVYFGKMLGASANGRFAGLPCPMALPGPWRGPKRPNRRDQVLGKMDQSKSCGTLLNQRFLPQVLKTEEDLDKLALLIRSYFKLNGHHIQFNIVDTDTLKEAQKNPDGYRDLLVRVAGYSDYFVDLDEFHQSEIINRTAHESF